MDVPRIAVTGAGGGVGQGIIKALQGSRYEVVALDGDAFATGLYAARTARIIPYATRPDYVDRLIEVCLEEGCGYLFPGLDAELPVLAASRDRFHAVGVTVIVSDSDVIEVANDKLATYNALTALGASVPRTVDLGTERAAVLDLGFPLVLKERVGGARSQNLFIVSDRDELGRILSTIDSASYIAQEYIEGDEYTCGTITLDGRCRGVIAMRRVLRDGDTYKAFTIRDETIESAVRRIVDGIRPFGACNVQLRVRDGEVHVFEINARCSGTTAARALSGFNEPRMILDWLAFGIEPEFTIKEQTVLRYWQELVIGNDAVAALVAGGRRQDDSPTPL